MTRYCSPRKFGNTSRFSTHTCLPNNDTSTTQKAHMQPSLKPDKPPLFAPQAPWYWETADHEFWALPLLSSHHSQTRWNWWSSKSCKKALMLVSCLQRDLTLAATKAETSEGCSLEHIKYIISNSYCFQHSLSWLRKTRVHCSKSACIRLGWIPHKETKTG